MLRIRILLIYFCLLNVLYTRHTLPLYMKLAQLISFYLINKHTYQVIAETRKRGNKLYI